MVVRKDVEVLVKWVKGIYSKEARPKAYLMRNKKPVRQLTFAELEEFASMGFIDDVTVVGWLRQQRDWKVLKESEAQEKHAEAKATQLESQTSPGVETKTNEVPEEFKPRTPELYAYLESLYGKVRTPGSNMGFGDVMVQKAHHKRRADY